MNNFKEFYKRLNHARQAFILVPALMLSIAACATTSTTSSTASNKAQLMFVQISEDVKVDPATKHLPAGEGEPANLVFLRSAATHRRASQNGRLSQGMDSAGRQG